MKGNMKGILLFHMHLFLWFLQRLSAYLYAIEILSRCFKMNNIKVY